jgi:hypothetical protein
MAGVMTELRDRFVDFVWPRATGSQESPPDYFDGPFELTANLRDEVKDMLLQRMPQSENRMVAVDRKLLSMFRITSLLATITIAILVGAAGLTPTGDRHERILAWPAIVFILYGILQLTRALSATVQGLERSRYARQSKETIMPLEDEDLIQYKERQISDIIYVTEQHEWATNGKVTQLAVAYRAIRNATISLTGLIIVALVLAYLRLG